MDWIFLLLAALSGLLFTVGDIFLKYWANRSYPYQMALAFLFYLIGGVVLGFSFRRKEIAIAVAVLICFNLIAVSIIGFTLFKESLGLKQVLGLSLVAIAIFILNT